MSQGETDDPEVSAALSEYLLMTELPQMTPERIDALTTDRFALYVAQAELAAEKRQHEATTTRAIGKGGR